MILRIVRMDFHPENLSHFHRLFDAHKSAIRQVEGCMHLELHADPDHPQVRYTYSHWQSQAALDAYRQSPLFGIIWPQTKRLFASKAQAFSLSPLETISPFKRIT